jgi:hypothetical protein
MKHKLSGILLLALIISTACASAAGTGPTRKKSGSGTQAECRVTAGAILRAIDGAGWGHGEGEVENPRLIGHSFRVARHGRTRDGSLVLSLEGGLLRRIFS